MAPHLPEILLGSFLTMLSLYFLFEGMSLITVGVSHAVRQSLVIVSLAVLGWLLIGDKLSIFQWGLIFFILLGNVVFRLSESELPKHLNTKGLVLGVLSGITSALGLFLMGKVSQNFDPYLSGYIWEVGIAVFALIVSVFKQEQKDVRPSFRDYWSMLWRSSPTVVGTFGFGLAATLGPMGIIGAIQAGSIVVIAVLSLFWHREKLTSWQWVAIVLITAAIIAFRLI